MDNEKFITVHTFTFAHEMPIVRGRLESEGITCFVQDELTLQVFPFYSQTIGGVKLQVKESDLPRAVEILKEAGYIKDENRQPAKPPCSDKRNEKRLIMEGEKMICPFCGSEEVTAVKKAGILFLFTSLLFLAPSPFFHREFYCFDCQQEFRGEKIQNPKSKIANS